MSEERVFQVDEALATQATPLRLADVGLLERKHLQEWALSHPHILGEDVLILTSEFDRWQSVTGDSQRDRLDVLGIDSDGRLVLAELKRDRAPNSVQLQAITYAAFASSFTEADVYTTLQAHVRQQEGETISEEEAEQRILKHCGPLDIETLRSPRIVLVAGEFTPTTTASVVWLTEQGLNITMQRVQAYQISSGETIVTVSQLYPLPEIENFRVSTRQAAVKNASTRSRGRREQNTVVRLLDSGALGDGTKLQLVPTNEIGPQERQLVIDWLEEHPEQARATWENTKPRPLRWEADGEMYSPTSIVKQVVFDATGIDRSFAGPRWWRVEGDDRSLPEIAGSSDVRKFDWNTLHGVLALIPRGKWSSYGDLAGLVGTAAQPLGQHLANCHECTNAWRVLDSQGESRPQFAWADPGRIDTQREALEAEGVAFDYSGRASDSTRLTESGLKKILSAVILD